MCVLVGGGGSFSIEMKEMEGHAREAGLSLCASDSNCPSNSEHARSTRVPEEGLFGERFPMGDSICFLL